jgi:hypothetical protein
MLSLIPPKPVAMAAFIVWGVLEVDLVVMEDGYSDAFLYRRFKIVVFNKCNKKKVRISPLFSAREVTNPENDPVGVDLEFTLAGYQSNKLRNFPSLEYVSMGVVRIAILLCAATGRLPKEVSVRSCLVVFCAGNCKTSDFLKPFFLVQQGL